MNDFCSQKRIKREFSNARTLQQNGVAERRNRTLIEAARTMLADAKLPVIFWVEAVNTACYVQTGYIVLPNWAHDALLESTSSKPYEESISQVPEGSRNPNPTASAFIPPADQMKTLTVESPISTVSSPVLTACLNNSSEPSSKARLVLKRVAIQEETPSMDNILSLTNRFDDILGVSTSSDEIIRVEADVSNMEHLFQLALLLLSESIRTIPRVR
nr:ribonuclease H-like domain-containing protein [Tanacetum cinerariifolium]